MLSLGIDIGGTFTDLVVFDHATGQVVVWKESTAPADPAQGVITGAAHLLRTHAIDPGRIQRTVRAATLFTNALIEMRAKSTVAFLAERTRIPGFGIEGGKPGAVGVLQINGESVDPRRQYILLAGDTVLLATPGGGGYGKPPL